MDPSALYGQYLAQEDTYSAAAESFALTIRECLETRGVVPFTVTARHKAPLELFNKQRKKMYPDPWLECPDLVGARVIVSDKVRSSEVLDILRNATALEVFEVEDQAHGADPSRISYQGLHVHARISGLVNLEGNPIRCEIQIRTIAEHAWAETQHRFIYKKPIEVPPEIRRLFNRLLVLIELFDLELAKGVEAMQALESYRALELSRHLDTLLTTYTQTPSDLELTIETLQELSDSGLGSIEDLRGLTDSYMSHNAAIVEKLIEEYGPTSVGFDVADDWILTQGESLVFLALLEARPDQFSNALHGSDLYRAVESLALKTGNSAFIRN